MQVQSTIPTPIIANIDAQVRQLEVRSDRYDDKFNEHDAKLKEHDARLKGHEAKLSNQDRILNKSNEILESLKNTHCEHVGWTRAPHGIAAVS